MRLILLLVVCVVLSEAFTGPGRRWTGVKLSPRQLSQSAQGELEIFQVLPSETKDKYFANFLARNEDLLARNEDLLARSEERINEMHESMKKIESKDQELLSKDQELLAQYKLRLLQMETELLRAKGLLTARGIFEHFLRACFEELVVENIFSPKAKFNVSEVISKLEKEKESIKANSYMTSCGDFYSYQEECGLEDVALLYEELCREVHGYPWSGEGVRMHAELLSKNGFSCYLTRIASRYDLKSQFEDGDTLKISGVSKNSTDCC